MDNSASGSAADCSPGLCAKGRFFESLCVNPGGTNGCEATISAAVAKISLSDVVITVAPGTYVDNVSISIGANPYTVSPTRKPLKLTIASSSTASSTIINGNNNGPVFTIGPNAKVQLQNLTITGGTGGSVQGETVGGGIFASGADLDLIDCVVTNNQADFGGGIYAADSDLEVENSTITDNIAATNGGGIVFASTKGRDLKIVDTSIDGNSASYSGGGVSISGGFFVRSVVNIEKTTISNNTAIGGAIASGLGGGLDINSAKLTMTDSTIAGNSAQGIESGGGGMHTVLTTAYLDNVTVANNSAAGSAGGIYVNATSATIPINPVNYRKEQTFVVANTIIADNDAPASPDCASGVPTRPIISRGHNLIGDSSGCVVSGQTKNDIAGDPSLGPLQNNGGTTDTQALLAGSPALGAGNSAKPDDKGRHGRCVSTDQIGTPRPQGECDIGAWQLPQ